MNKNWATCKVCNGDGYHWHKVMNLGTREMEDHIVTCIAITCRNGKSDPEAFALAMGGPAAERILASRKVA